MARTKTERVSVSFRLDREQRENLRILAAFHFTSETAMVEKLIAEELDRLKGNRKTNERLQQATKAAKARGDEEK